MQIAGRYILIGIAATLLQSCVVADGDRWASCDRNTRIQVVDLDMSPDPIGEGQRVREWRVGIRADDRTRCDAVLQIRERAGTEVAARERVSRLKAGMNRIEIEPSESFRFSRSEHCLVVVANLEGNYRPVDSARRFCARQISNRRWTLKD